MPTVAQVRTAIVTALSGITVVRWYDKYPGQIVGPAGVVRRLTYDYGVDFEGDGNATYAVSIFLPITEIESAQQLMDSLLATSGASSIASALEADMDLGGVVQYVNVLRATEDGTTSLSGIEHLTATVTMVIGGA